MSEALWYYDEAGKQAGPITGAAVREAITSGRLAPGTRVWTAGMAGWQPWETVPELAALAAPPAPTTLVSPPPPPGFPPPAGQPQGWGAASSTPAA
ncbi:MAG TPA: DUF4339 domain-containing protein, partial [Anaeromyxobacteraceae bacterium]|nr:DUF4339 domain-containing protein [Anaeromyxobacteraceae bacterium]